MKKQNRILMGLAALILGFVFIFPIWSIQLHAPQYPEGIGLNISIDKIEGKLPHDLQNLNGLNHYIGMKPIVPDSIPELKLMPYIFVFLIGYALLIAIFGNHKWVLSWVIIFTILAIAGLVDFWLWEYDYGHNLNPDAPIKVPGMSYQPPLLGKKQLLNITAVSLPHIGFFLALVSMGLASLVWWREKPKKQ